MRFSSAVFDPATDTVTLVLKKPFARNKAIQVAIDGTSPLGLEDSLRPTDRRQSRWYSGWECRRLDRCQPCDDEPVFPASLLTTPVTIIVAGAIPNPDTHPDLDADPNAQPPPLRRPRTIDMPVRLVGRCR